ncbi:hypothetical protein ACQEVZ_24805 [Dactylosporangium sp. CA-152071]|uniref:hypothetical protein n=1 Tax=Dactylosporangium sp. CA-152071 TaxID=3239933 RepID=UPI003D8EEFF2
MSLPTITGTGQLLGDPKTGPTRTGGTWTNCVVKFQAWRKGVDGWEEGDAVVAAVITFDDEAGRILSGLGKGDSITVTGTATVGLWKDTAQLRITADTIALPVRRAKGGDQPPPSASSRRREEAPATEWPKPAVPGQVTGLHQPLTGAGQRGPSAVLVNLRQHADRRRNAS